VAGLFPANAVPGDTVEIYTDESRSAVLTRFHMLRQQGKKSAGIPNLSLSDYLAPVESGLIDYMGGFAVTAGIGVEELCKRFEAEHDDYNSILAKALADRLAEAFAERMHEIVRKDLWGYAAEEHLSNEDLIKEEYTGIRPAPGYPACPEHSEKRVLFDLLEADQRTPIRLTESFAMYPTAAVSGFYFAHPQSKYFPVGKLLKDQIEDYAARKGWTVEEAEKWLSPYLAYEETAV
jgi:5-methyltetrahydrofolate--homocysteine methyltransferase